MKLRGDNKVIKNNITNGGIQGIEFSSTQSGRMTDLCIDDNIFITDTSNLDGMEIGQAIYTVFKQISELSWMNLQKQ